FFDEAKASHSSQRSRTRLIASGGEHPSPAMIELRSIAQSAPVISAGCFPGQAVLTAVSITSMSRIISSEVMMASMAIRVEVRLIAQADFRERQWRGEL